MALLTSEIRRIKAELGQNLLTVGAEPQIGIQAIFEQVVAAQLTAGATTTSTTSVTAATTPTLVTLTLASVTGITAGDRVVVDVDARQESAIVEVVTGSTISLQLSKTHAGTYAVTVEGGESIVRELLTQIQAIGGMGGGLQAAQATAGVKKADEVEFFGGAGDRGTWQQLAAQREQLRDELASVLGVQRLNRGKRASGATRTELY